MSSHSNTLVFETINANPRITLMQIAQKIGLSRQATGVVIADLIESGRILVDLVPKEAGVGGPPSRGFTANPAYRPALPETWEVLGRFFGRIAAPEAEAA